MLLVDTMDSFLNNAFIAFTHYEDDGVPKYNEDMIQFLKKLLDNKFIVALLLFLAAWFLYKIRLVIVILFLSFIIMSAMTPLARFFHKRTIPWTLSVIIPYFLVLFIIALLLALIVPAVTTQVGDLAQNLPGYINAVGNFIGTVGGPNISSAVVSNISDSVTNVLNNIFSITGIIFEFILAVFTVVIVSFYLTLDRDRVFSIIAELFSKERKEKIFSILHDVEQKMGVWLRSQILISFIVGTLIWIVLLIIGIDYAASLAVFAGIMEIIPYVGPIIAAVPAVAIALSDSIAKAVVVIAAYLLIQLLESYIIVPQVMKRNIYLHPVVVIMGIVTGGILWGLIGALLAVPIISIFVLSLNRAFPQLKRALSNS
jgi:predicted PurR-regulated permease PerM